LFAGGICFFAWYIQGGQLLSFLAIAGLLLPTFAIYRQVIADGHANEIWSSSKTKPIRIAFTIIGFLIGIFAGILYRRSFGAENFPANLTWFAITAAAIGATEEILFRGALFYLMRKQHYLVSILIAALLHASYKSILFLSPYAQHPVNTWYLFYVTFLAGLVLGMLRYLASSTMAPLVAHSTWDIIVYGNSEDAPWWVW
jgi:membrane protease YdiL (CAAX protease family)